MFGVHAILSLIQKLRLMFWFTCCVSFSGARRNLLIGTVWSNGSHSCLVGCIGIVDALDVRTPWALQLAFTVHICHELRKTSYNSFRRLLHRTLWTTWKKSPVVWEIDCVFEILLHTHRHFLALWKRLVTGWHGGQWKSENNVLKLPLLVWRIKNCLDFIQNHRS